MPKEILGLLKNMIKMFSPRLDVSLYENGEKVSKVRKLFRKVGNSSEPSMEYTESTHYSYSQTEESTVLENEASIESTGDTHNSIEDTSASSEFSSDGELEESVIDSNS